jgi:hypothetical protein
MSKEKSENREKKNALLKDRKQSKVKHEYETMSQQQNRHGKGRQQNGSDGSGIEARGSNH